MTAQNVYLAWEMHPLSDFKDPRDAFLKGGKKGMEGWLEWSPHHNLTTTTKADLECPKIYKNGS